jgi:hypothetical protein
VAGSSGNANNGGDTSTGGNPATGGNANAGGNAGTGGSAGQSQSAGSAGVGGSPDQCAPIAPCGGSPVGTWRVTSFCEPAQTTSALGALCPGATALVSNVQITGSYTFSADGTYSVDANVSLSESLDLPASCYTQAQCAAFQTTLAGETGVTSAACQYDAATGCRCSATISQQTTGPAGTYVVNGTSLTITPSSNGMSEVEGFCVSGNTLSLQGTNTSGQNSTLIATRQ